MDPGGNRVRFTLPLKRKTHLLISKGLCISGSWSRLTRNFSWCSLSMNRPPYRQVLECASPLALSNLVQGRKSGRGLPQSKTLARQRPPRRGSWSQGMRKSERRLRISDLAEKPWSMPASSRLGCSCCSKLPAVNGAAAEHLLDAEELHVGNEQIVADELDFLAEFVRQFLPIRPVALRAAVLDANDGVAGTELGVVLHQLDSGQLAAGAFLQDIVAVAAVKLRTGDVQRQKNLPAG